MRLGQEALDSNEGEPMGMEGLVEEASYSFEEFDLGKPRIIVVGCGGAGCNSVHRLQRIGVYGAETIAINTDKAALDRIDANKKILIGQGITRGLGAGGRPEVGERCAELAEKELRATILGADLTFLTVGMGGGTGTGVAPFIANLCKSSGSIVIAMATTPFKAERGRLRIANYGLERLRKTSDSVIVLENDRLLKFVPDLPVEQAFSVMDQLISEVIKGVTEAITLPSLINLDFADVKAVMQSGGTSTLLCGENSSHDPDKVVAETLSNPFLDIDYSRATGALIHLTSGPSLSLKIANKVVEGITHELSEETNVIFGARVDSDYEGVIKVISILTGVQSSNLLVPTRDLDILEIREVDFGIPFVR